MANEKDLDIQEQLKKHAQDIAEAMEKQYEARLGLMTLEEKSAAAAQALLEIQKEELANAKEQLAQAQKATDLSDKAQRAAINQAKVKVALTEADIKATEGVVAATEDVAKSMNDAFKSAERFSETLTGIDDRAKLLGKSLTKDGKILRNIGSRTGKILGDMGQSFTMANQLGKAFKKAEDGVVGLNDKLDATAKKYGIMAAIGRAREFETFVKHSARDVGIITDEAMRAQEALFESAVEGTVHTRQAYHEMNRSLFQNSTAFRKASKSTRQELTLVGADLAQTFNVEGATSVRVMEELGTTFGKTGTETAKLTADLAMMAQVQGRDVNKTMKDFAEMSGQLAKFGLPSATKEFARLQAIEEKTGASMGNLVSAMDTFSTFEGALNAASKLNAVFGSTIDGMELMDSMMTGGPAEALLLLRQRLDETGQSFETMNYAQKRAMAEATGVGVQDLAKYMSVPFDELSQAVNESDGSIESLTNSQEKLAAATNGTLTAAEAQAKLQDDQAKVVGGLARLLEWVEKNLAQMTPAWAAFGLAAVQAMGGIMGAIGSAIGKMITQKTIGTAAHTTRIAQLQAEIAMLHARNAAEAGGGGGGGGGINRLSKRGKLAQIQALKRKNPGMTTKKALQMIGGGGGGALRGVGMGSAGAGTAAGGAGLGAILAGAAVVAGAGYAGYKMADSSGWLGSENTKHFSTEGFDAGLNMASEGKMATVGEAGSPEVANIGGQNYMVGMGGPQTVALGAGDSVSTTGGGGSSAPQRVVMNFTFVDENGAKKTERIERVMKDYMNENLNLSYT